jgi:hypothetical protein
MLFDPAEHGHIGPEILKSTRLVPFERYQSAIRWQFARGVLIGMVVSASVAVPAFEYSRVRRKGAASQTTFDQTTPGNSDREAATRVPKQTAAESSPTAILAQPHPSTPNRSADSMQSNAAGNRAKASLPLAASQPVPFTDASFTNPGTNPAPTKKTLATIAQLWASVEAGDTKAALALADIYQRGEGVPVNCEQARVLLVVASKENNAEATKRLEDLNAAGCPAP